MALFDFGGLHVFVQRRLFDFVWKVGYTFSPSLFDSGWKVGYTFSFSDVGDFDGILIAACVWFVGKIMDYGILIGMITVSSSA